MSAGFALQHHHGQRGPRRHEHHRPSDQPRWRIVTTTPYRGGHRPAGPRQLLAKLPTARIARGGSVGPRPRWLVYETVSALMAMHRGPRDLSPPAPLPSRARRALPTMHRWRCKRTGWGAKTAERRGTRRDHPRLESVRSASPSRWSSWWLAPSATSCS